MATANQNQEEVPQNIRKQLALAVRSIQWSYAIFWSISSRQPGALEWGDGYYNGDIKTRKTVQASESKADQLGLQRSDQLRELYDSLSLGEANPQAKRPTAALSPEDLTDAEWYFLVCMSFVFNVDQGLPGRTLATNQMIWLGNAHRADTKVFTRSLLAKSASIQTIVCFPHLGGVVELGATELVAEDPNLIQHIKASFLESPSSASFSSIPKNCISNNITNDDNDLTLQVIDQFLDCHDVEICSPNNCLTDFADNLLIEEAVDGVEPSQMQSWHFMDDAISNCLNNSTNSSDCISQTHEDHGTMVPFPDGKKEMQNCMNDNQESNLQGNDIHYQSVLSNLLKSSHQLVLGPYFRNRTRESSFVSWRKDGLLGTHQIGVTQQKLLKKVLFEVPKMYAKIRIESGKDNGNSRQEADEVDKNHVLSERKRREKINERFVILGSLIPSGGKVDKVSILDHTIGYLRELERKVEELESYKEATETESTMQSKHQDSIERTSDNYGPSKFGNANTKKPSINKRKACDTDNNRVRSREVPTDNISVSVSEKDVLIELRCWTKDSVLLEVMEAIRKLRMDTQSVQSSDTDGILSMTIKAKCKGLKGPSPGVITQALQKIIRK